MESMKNKEPVPHPVFKVVMNGKDVTAVLSPYLLSVKYTDFEEGEADTLDITVEDTDGKFRGPWYPVKGQTLEMEFGYDGQQLHKTGLFEIDDIVGQGPPDVVVIRGIAAGVKHQFRTRQGKAYDNTTLAAIAQQVARRLKLKLVGKVEPIQIARVTQINETDLTFLRRLSGEYGYAFSVKGAMMVFVKRTDLRNSKPILSIDRTDLANYHVRDKIMGVATSAQVSYHDPKTKLLKHYRVQDTRRATSGDVIKLNVRAESDAQAKAKANAALEKANEDATQLELTPTDGNPMLVAGINFDLTGLGKFGGTFHVIKSTHDIDRSGAYKTDVEAKRVLING
ncbi:MAG: bacteriophage regulatory [Gallionellaceae bacterium]|nr:MAG: bacteriophage regulatory [Gallionellaceae bacterium]